MRIAVLHFSHETVTFLANDTTLADFTYPGSPAKGDAVLAMQPRDYIGGFVQIAREHPNVELTGIESPGFPVTGTGSGWIRAHATPYRMILRSAPNASVARSWAEAWSLTTQIAQLKYASSNTWVDSDMTYLAYSRGALAYASKLGNPGVTENLNWATAQLLSSKSWKIPYKWRLGPGF